MAQFSDTDSVTSKALIQDLDGGPEHLQILNESKVAIRLAARKHRAAYACFVAMDPQTWEDPACDLDLYEEVSEVDNQIMNICLAVSLWSKEIVEACDPYNQHDRSFCRGASSFIARIKGQVDRSPFLLKSNREDEHQMGEEDGGDHSEFPQRVTRDSIRSPFWLRFSPRLRPLDQAPPSLRLSHQPSRKWTIRIMTRRSTHPVV